MEQSKLIKDFDIFTRALVDSRDVDPTYRIIPYIVDHFGFQPEWFTFMYVAFYSLESSMEVCRWMPEAEDWNYNKFLELRNVVNKFGHERRGTARNPQRQIEHLSVVSESILNNSFDYSSNDVFRKNIEDIPLIGGWASFKIAEILEKSFGFDSLKIPDLGLQGRNPNSNDGPVGGLRWLFGREESYDKNWYSLWNNFGFALSKTYDYDIGEIETSLCKFHKLVSGKYFVGHDIQEFIELKESVGLSVYKDMMGQFNPMFWEDVEHLQKPLKKLYKETGEVYGSELARKEEKDILNIMLEL